MQEETKIKHAKQKPELTITDEPS